MAGHGDMEANKISGGCLWGAYSLRIQKRKSDGQPTRLLLCALDVVSLN